MFTEDVIEKMIIDSLVKNGWEYIPAEKLPRNYTDVMVEPMVRDALIRLNPEIAANPSYADEVIIKLRPLFMQAKAADLVTINEEFKNQIFEKNSFPFGENHSFIPISYLISIFPRAQTLKPSSSTERPSILPSLRSPL